MLGKAAFAVESQHMIRQYPLTVAAGKRLIAKAMLVHPAIKSTLANGKLVIVAGTTNGYIAEEILLSLGQSVGFSRKHFFRGITVAPAWITNPQNKLPDGSAFPGDIVIHNGVWKRTKTIFDVAPTLDENDLILKGANAVDLINRHAASYVDHPETGPVGAVLSSTLGKRTRLLLPVGVEKRVPGNLATLANRLSAANAKGPRLCLLSGEIFTELDAITLLTGASAEIVAAGGVAGGEGCTWLAISGNQDELTAMDVLMRAIHAEPAFTIA
jgi:hypothetical protein